MPEPLVENITDYFRVYGHYHTEKAAVLLKPLHTPGVDEVPVFAGITRQPFEPQAHGIAASIAMLDHLKRGIFVGQMGVGKTIMGQLVAHEHARRSRRKGGRNGNYRALVLCPDHLIQKWKDEILMTIPGAKVTVFDAQNKGCRQLLTDMRDLHDRLSNGSDRWPTPEGAEWYVLGRDQSKLGPSKVNAAPLAQVERRDHQTVKHKRHVCPKCGATVADKSDVPINVAKSSKQLRCTARWAVQVPEPDRKDQGLLRRLITGDGKDLPDGVIREQDGIKYRTTTCNEPLWQYVAKPKRWPPALFIRTKLRRAFHYILVDEVHEQKSKVTAQANAMGSLVSAIPHCLALTGTLIGGHAKDLFYLLMRMNARALLEDGFNWSSVMKFTKQYGRIERTVTKTEGKVKRGRRQSMRTEDEGDETEKAAPGIMPALFGAHLLDRTVFLSLDDMSDNLPLMREYVGGPPLADYDADDHEFYENCHCTLEPNHEAEYKRVEDALVSECKQLMIKGNMALLGTMLSALLAYPDYPWDWDVLGYMQKPKGEEGGPGTFIPVVRPCNLPEDHVYPKERALLSIVERAVKAGDKVWVYVNMTDKRDIQVRLERLLTEKGHRVKVLRSKAVAPKKRIAWIEKNGPKCDVVISHPQLVQTGVDFFGKDRSYNFNDIVFYETGYSVFTLRQAAARAWRLLQWRKCRVYYLHYVGTMQQRAMVHIARKMAAATQLDGELNVEGLTALADDGSAAMALARSIGNAIEDKDVLRQWSKIGQTIKPAGLAALGLDSIDLTPLDGLDDLPMPLALAAGAILAHDPTYSRAHLASAFAEFELSEEDLALMEAF